MTEQEQALLRRARLNVCVGHNTYGCPHCWINPGVWRYRRCAALATTGDLVDRTKLMPVDRAMLNTADACPLGKWAGLTPTDAAPTTPVAEMTAVEIGQSADTFRNALDPLFARLSDADKAAALVDMATLGSVHPDVAARCAEDMKVATIELR